MAKISKISFVFVLFLFIISCSQNTVLIKDEAPWYFPAVLEVEPGTTVSWDDSMAMVVHPVNTLNAPEQFSSGHFTKTWEYTFDKPGIYHYFCPIHPYMQGFIGVGEKVPSDVLPSWIKSWPPESANAQIPGGLPKPGVGEVWLDAQFHSVEGKDKPGTVIVIDAETWEIKKIIDDKRLNNPHNMWLSDDKNHILQTNWFDSYLSVIDRYSGLVLKHIYVGESPAHVMTANGKIYVTLQGADSVAVLDGKTYELEKTIKTVQGEHTHTMTEAHRELGRGPHGNWMSMDGKTMVIAHTEGGSVSFWNLKDDSKFFEFGTDILPLMAGISHDGKFAWTASHLTGEFYAFDVGQKKLIKQYALGKGPVQLIPSPDGKYIVAGLSSEGNVAVIDAITFELVKKLPSGSGAHGVYFGPKKDGGWYAYVSNKFVPWIAVVDMDLLEIAGYVPLPKEALGGQGILVVYD